MTARIPVDRKRALIISGALVGLAVALGACTHTDEVVATASVPDDYRQRHPIAIQEANRSIVIFVGHARGGLSAEQRADVMGLAQAWTIRRVYVPTEFDVLLKEMLTCRPGDPDFKLHEAMRRGDFIFVKISRSLRSNNRRTNAVASVLSTT